MDEGQNVVRMRYNESRKRWTINPPQQDAGEGDAVALYIIQERHPTSFTHPTTGIRVSR